MAEICSYAGLKGVETENWEFNVKYCNLGFKIKVFFYF